MQPPAVAQYVPLASPLHDPSSLASLLGRFETALRSRGITAARIESFDRNMPLVLVMLTGGTEQRTLELCDEMPDRRAPVVLLAHGSHNSLPAALETLARLRQDQRRGIVAYVEPDDNTSWQSLLDAVNDAAVAVRLQHACLGLVGRPSDWLVASRASDQAVHESWGPRLVPIALDRVYRELEAPIQEPTRQLATGLLHGATDARDLASGAALDAARVYQALRAIATHERLDAMTVRCFDLVINHKLTGCFALAQLNDEGLVAGCEGDVAATVGMLWARHLLGATTWMANPSRIDTQADTLWLAHCTIARSMLQSYRLETHFESGLGLALAGEMQTGAVTLFRLGGKDLRTLWTCEGQLVETGQARDLCRTQAKIEMPAGAASELLERPLGNHLLMVRGHHAGRLRNWYRRFGPGA